MIRRSLHKLPMTKQHCPSFTHMAARRSFKDPPPSGLERGSKYMEEDVPIERVPSVPPDAGALAARPVRYVKNSYPHDKTAFRPASASGSGGGGGAGPRAQAPGQPPVAREIRLAIKNSYPHDKTAFTQGLVFYKGRAAELELYESLVIYGKTEIRRVRWRSGDTLWSKRMTKHSDINSITFIDEMMYQVTRSSRKLVEYKLAPILKKPGEYIPPDFTEWEEAGARDLPKEVSEGWGLTNDGSDLIMSDGSNHVYYVDPKTLDVKKAIAVYITEHGRDPRTGEVVTKTQGLDMLNEMLFVNEKVGDVIFANVWQDTRIMVIPLADVRAPAAPGQPHTVHVRHFIECRDIHPDGVKLQMGAQSGIADILSVMNGMAYHKDRGTYFLTGQLWPSMHEVVFDLQSDWDESDRTGLRPEDVISGGGRAQQGGFVAELEDAESELAKVGWMDRDDG